MRNRLITIAICLSATLFAAAPASAQGNTNIGELSINFWTINPEIVIQSDSLTGVSQGTITDIDLVQEFGIENKSLPGFRFVVGRRHKFRLGYVPIKYEAEALLQREIRSGSTTIPIGAPASTDIKWDLWSFGYEWDFVSTDAGYFGVVGELKYNKMEALVDSPLLTESAGIDENVPVPTIGVAGRGYMHPMVSVGGEFTMFKITRDEFEAKFFDFDINGAVTFGRYIGVQGGYRSVTVEFFTDEDLGDLKFKGPYIGAHLKF